MQNAELRTYLRSHPACSGLRSQELDRIEAESELRSFATDASIVDAGKPLTEIILIVRGRFALIAPGSDEPIAHLKSGDQIGALQLFRGGDSILNVRAAEPSLCICVAVRNADQMVNESAQFMKNLLRLAASQVVALTRAPSPPTQRKAAFIHADATTHRAAGRVLQRLVQLEETHLTVTNMPGAEPTEHTVVLDDLADPSNATVLRERIGRHADVDRLVAEIEIPPSKLDVTPTAELVAFVDAVYVLVTPINFRPVFAWLRRVLDGTPSWTRKFFVVWVLPRGCQVAPGKTELGDRLARNFKLHDAELVAENQSDFQSLTGWEAGGVAASTYYPPRESSAWDPDVERIVHHLRDVQIGLALGGGAARGMAHLGVLRALEEHGIVFDQAAGTSVGAMLGVTYCSGYSSQFSVERYAEDLKLRGLYKWFGWGGLFYMLMKYRTRGWEPMLRKYFFDWTLDQLPIPIVTVGADLISGEEIVRRDIDCVRAILESINLPVLSPPLNRDGTAIVDGGVLNVVPADHLIPLGANYIIGVDVASRMPCEFAGNQRDTPTSEMRTAGVVRVFNRIRAVQDRNLSRLGSAAADFTIEPDISSVQIDAFGDTPRIAQIGYVAANEAMPALKRQLHQIDPLLFPLPSNASNGHA